MFYISKTTNRPINIPKIDIFFEQFLHIALKKSFVFRVDFHRTSAFAHQNMKLQFWRSFFHVLSLHHVHETINILLILLFADSIIEFFFSFNVIAKVRRYIAKEFQRHGFWKIDVILNVFARKFEVKTLLNWVFHQFFNDCIWAKIVNDDVIRLNYAHEHVEIIDFQFFCDLNDEIDINLCDWWLSNIGFFLNYKKFQKWQKATKDDMTWDLIEFWEFWHDVNYAETIKKFSAKKKLSYDEKKNKILIEHEKKKAVIEAKVVKMGLWLQNKFDTYKNRIFQLIDRWRPILFDWIYTEMIQYYITSRWQFHQTKLSAIWLLNKRIFAVILRHVSNYRFFNW